MFSKERKPYHSQFDLIVRDTFPQYGSKRTPTLKTSNSSSTDDSSSDFEFTLDNGPSYRSKASHNYFAQPDQKQTGEKRNDQERPKRNEEIYVDECFFPNDKSLLGRFFDPKTLEEFGNIVWKSIVRIRIYQLVVGKIEAKDILQTFLGDCYFLAVLCALAEKPKRVLALFPKIDERRGIFELFSYYLGEKNKIRLDSYLPFTRNAQKKLETLTDTNGMESWVILLEKLFAKEFGSYVAIIGGLPTEAMRFLTGAPAERFFTSDVRFDSFKKDSLWAMLAENPEYLFTCCTNDEPADLKKMGLIENHAYTILHAFTTRSGERLLVIRNPWGKRDNAGNGEWKGEWSDFDLEKWTNRLKELPYKYKGANDGVFHMSYDDFLRRFESVEVCHLYDNFILRSSGRITSSRNEEESFSLIIEDKQTDFFIMVNQESSRKFSPCPNFEYSKMTFSVYEAERKLLEVTGDDQQIFKKISLAPGEYEVRVKVRWSNFALKNNINYFVLNTYGPKNVK